MSTDLTNTAPPKWLEELRSPIEALPTDLVTASGRRVMPPEGVAIAAAHPWEQAEAHRWWAAVARPAA